MQVKKITTISEVVDQVIYTNLINKLLKKPILRLLSGEN